MEDFFSLFFFLMNYNKLGEITIIKINYRNLVEAYKPKDSLINRIKYYQEYVAALDGFWFKFTENKIMDECVVVGNFYIGENELTGNIEGYINVLIDGKLNELLNVKKLLGYVEEYSKNLKEEYDCMCIYIQIDVGNEEDQKEIIKYTISSNLSLLSYVVHKELKIISDINVKGLHIRIAEDKDYSNIIECLVQAYMNGTLPFMYEEIGLQKYKENIKTYFSGLLNDNNIVLVGEYNGEFCGHIALNIDKTDFINRDGQAKLIDTYVLNEFSGLKIGTALTKEGERQCIKKGIFNIVATVDENINDKDQATSVLTKLKKEDWNVESIIMLG